MTTVLIDCNCAAIPPTMPTCRDKHLPSCPAAAVEQAYYDGMCAIAGHLRPKGLHGLCARCGRERSAEERLAWAREVLADPARASVEMSGMSSEELAELRREFEGEDATP